MAIGLAIAAPVASTILGLIALLLLPVGNIVPSLVIASLQLIALVAFVSASSIVARRVLVVPIAPRRWLAWLALGTNAATVVAWITPVVIAIAGMLTDGYFG